MSPPTLPSFPPPPRRVRLRRAARGRVWLLRLFTVPFVAMAASLAGMLLADPVTRWAGSAATGRIATVRPSPGTDDGQHYDVTFAYGVGRTGTGRLDTENLNPPVVGRPVAIVVPPAGLPFCRAVLADQDLSAAGLACGGVFVVLWCGFVGLFTAAVWVGPGLAGRRVRDGVAVTGNVIALERVKVGRSVRHAVTYRYQTADGHEGVTTTAVRPAVFDQLERGQPVTVLYAAATPGRSVLYVAADHEVVPAR